MHKQYLVALLLSTLFLLAASSKTIVGQEAMAKRFQGFGSRQNGYTFWKDISWKDRLGTIKTARTVIKTGPKMGNSYPVLKLEVKQGEVVVATFAESGDYFVLASTPAVYFPSNILTTLRELGVVEPEETQGIPLDHPQLRDKLPGIYLGDASGKTLFYRHRRSGDDYYPRRFRRDYDDYDDYHY
jgi:hypothetical protein